VAKMAATFNRLSGDRPASLIASQTEA
jgi:hypothetical protein